MWWPLVWTVLPLPGKFCIQNTIQFSCALFVSLTFAQPQVVHDICVVAPKPSGSQFRQSVACAAVLAQSYSTAALGGLCTEPQRPVWLVAAGCAGPSNSLVKVLEST